MLDAHSMKCVMERSVELADLVGELRRLLASPAHASEAWDCFHDTLMRDREFVESGARCVHPALVGAVETALEELSGKRFALEHLTLVHAEAFELVHGVAVAGGNLVFMVFCEQTRRGLIGLPFLKSGKLMLLHVTVAEVDANFLMAPASC